MSSYDIISRFTGNFFKLNKTFAGCKLKELKVKPYDT